MRIEYCSEDKVTFSTIQLNSPPSIGSSVVLDFKYYKVHDLLYRPEADSVLVILKSFSKKDMRKLRKSYLFK